MNDNKIELVDCNSCKYYKHDVDVGAIYCTTPTNIKEKSYLLGFVTTKKLPEELNKNNDCSLYEESKLYKILASFSNQNFNQ